MASTHSSSLSSAAINDLLASLSESAIALHSSLPPQVAAEVVRQREEQRRKIAVLISHVQDLTQPKDVSTTLNGVFIQSSHPHTAPHAVPTLNTNATSAPLSHPLTFHVPLAVVRGRW